MDNEEFYTRKNSLRLPGFDYSSRACFVTINVEGFRPIFFNKPLAREVVNCLFGLRLRYEFNLYVYCLMPDHFHAVIGPGGGGRSIGEICGGFKSLAGRAYWKYGSGSIWQRQFHNHVIRNEEDFYECVRYVRLNPVRRGLVEKWQDREFTGSPDLR